VPDDTAFFTLFGGLPRQAPGSDRTTRELLRLAGPLPDRPQALDVGCGPGRSTLVLAQEAHADVVAVDTHQPFLDQLDEAARSRGVADRIATLNRSMETLDVFPDGSFDLVWAEGSAYVMGFDTALRAWQRLLRPGGCLVATELEWTGAPSQEARAFWQGVYPLRDHEQNTEVARAAGYTVEATLLLPDEDWWQEYYTPLADRLARADRSRPGMDEAVTAVAAEIDLRREHAGEYGYRGYVLRRGAVPGSSAR
jgi:ubiquinone/menaquinone biosynthesis C-methylase UbiE